jgi:carbamate kinase
VTDVKRRIVIALGGNALIQRNQPADARPQLENIRRAVDSLALLAHDNQLIITHGNGPQVGLLALESLADSSLARPYPLDALGAETQGLIGYWLLQSLQNALGHRNVAALVTQTLVSASDPAFGEPTKFIGPMYTEERATVLTAANGWTVKQDGTKWRRVVASPVPLELVEIEVINQLLDAGVLVVCGGGGGAPVVRNADGHFEGVDAVVDKDLTSALIAEAVHADSLILLTDVAAVLADVHDAASAIGDTTPLDLRSYNFPAGSMGPKVEAVCSFVERTGGTATIGALADVVAIAAGLAGTRVTPN